MTGALHTAGINAIEVIVSSDKLIKMVNFKLAHEMWRSINQNYLSDAIVIQEAEIEISSMFEGANTAFLRQIKGIKGKSLFCINFRDLEVGKPFF